MKWLKKNLLGIGSFVSGLLGRNQEAKDARRNREQSQAQFDAQMDESVQRRVADAKKAGIHPIFALGGNVGASPTSSAGSNRSGDALAGISRNLMDAQIERTRAEATKAIAEAEAASAAAKATQAGSSIGRDGRTVTGLDELQPGASPTEKGVNIIPVEQPAKKAPGTQAGTKSVWMEGELKDGTKVPLISDEIPGGEELNMVILPYHGWRNNVRKSRARLRKLLGTDKPFYKVVDGKVVLKGRGKITAADIRRVIDKFKGKSAPPRVRRAINRRRK